MEDYLICDDIEYEILKPENFEKLSEEEKNFLKETFKLSDDYPN